MKSPVSLLSACGTNRSVAPALPDPRAEPGRCQSTAPGSLMSLRSNGTEVILRLRASLATSFIESSKGWRSVEGFLYRAPFILQLDMPLEIFRPEASTTSMDSTALSSPMISMPIE